MAFPRYRLLLRTLSDTPRSGGQSPHSHSGWVDHCRPGTDREEREAQDAPSTAGRLLSWVPRSRGPTVRHGPDRVARPRCPVGHRATACWIAKPDRGAVAPQSSLGRRQEWKGGAVPGDALPAREVRPAGWPRYSPPTGLRSPEFRAAQGSADARRRRKNEKTP